MFKLFLSFDKKIDINKNEKENEKENEKYSKIIKFYTDISEKYKNKDLFKIVPKTEEEKRAYNIISGLKYDNNNDNTINTLVGKLNDGKDNYIYYYIGLYYLNNNNLKALDYFKKSSEENKKHVPSYFYTAALIFYFFMKYDHDITKNKYDATKNMSTEELKLAENILLNLDKQESEVVEYLKIFNEKYPTNLLINYYVSMYYMAQLLNDKTREICTDVVVNYLLRIRTICAHEEQGLINMITTDIVNKNMEIKKEYEVIDTYLEYSSVLNYYLGVLCKNICVMKKENLTTKESKFMEYFLKSSTIDNLFTSPVYEIADYFLKDDERDIEKEKIEMVKNGEDMGKRVYDDFIRDKREKFIKAECLLKNVYQKKTHDYTTITRDLVNNIEDNMRIASILSPIYMTDKSFNKILKLYEPLMEQFEKTDKKIFEKVNYMITWKNMCVDIGQVYFHKHNFEKAYEYYALGFKYGIGISKDHNIDFVYQENNNKSNYTINKYLMEACLLTRHYMLDWKKLPFMPSEIHDLQFSEDVVKKICDEPNMTKFEIFKKTIKYDSTGKINYFNVPFKNSFLNDKSTNKRIKIGYLSPDFNKNAVGLFCSVFFKFCDKTKFDVYALYTNQHSDEYTNIFRKLASNWVECGKVQSIELYRIIKSFDLDIIVDLIGHGYNNNIDVLAMLKLNNPNIKVISAIGYPDSTLLKSVDYRLVDNITDPGVSEEVSEKLLRMNKTFLCYYPFENETVPMINYFRDKSYKSSPFSQLYDPEDKRIRIGILNKSSKHSKEVIEDWKAIMESCPNVVFYIKLDQYSSEQIKLYDSLPKNRYKLISFKAFLQEYYEIYNFIDFCIDTYPYSGTTTTCSSLYMGVPTFAINNKNLRHVSNVSASILHYSDQKEFVVNSRTRLVNDVITYVNNFKCETNDIRHVRRNKFLQCMEPKEYMKNLEDLYKYI